MLKEYISPEKYNEIRIWLAEPETKKMIEDRRNNGQKLLKDNTPADVFHANSVEVIERDIEGLCKEGDLLMSFRNISLIGILDIDKQKLIWKWGPGQLDYQHHPMLLDNGNILIFDNGRHRRYSRVIEIDPFTGKIVWEYKSDPRREFFSSGRASSQRLPNGNTLITEANDGRIFEVTPGGDIVWEFYNPVIKEDTKERAPIHSMIRILHPETYPPLRELL
jgi:hypothetical protein